MAYSYVTYTADGATTQYAVPFPYIKTADIHITVDAVAKTFTWLNSSTIVLDTVPSADSKILIYRDTEKVNPSVIFQSGSGFRETELNGICTQLLYITQEATDNVTLDDTALSCLSAKTACESAIETVSAIKEDVEDRLDIIPCSFGRFAINDDGDLVLIYFGSSTTDEMTINDDGQLVITVSS